MTDWIDFLIPAAIGLLLLLGGASVLRSNAHQRVVWKFPVGWFSVILGGAAVIYSATVFPTDAASNIAARSTTSMTTVLTTSSTPTTSLATTTTLSYFASPNEAVARQWAEDAISYGESLGSQWNNRDGAIQFYASYGSQQCGYLSGELRFVRSNTLGMYPPNPPHLNPPGSYPAATPSQIEANLRVQLGIEAWESYGVAWFDSLVNGLCVRR